MPTSLRAWQLTLLPVAALAASLLAGGYERLLGFFEDDANYYFVIAENIVRGGHSTFDGTTTTTGYHPLWLLLNVALVWISGLDRSAYMAALIGLCALLSLAHAAILERLLRHYTGARWLGRLVVVLVVARSLKLSFSGMECAVTMPLMALCALETARQLESTQPISRLVLLGGLSALTGLARIDALPFGLACGALVLVHHHTALPTMLRKALLFGLGLTPFVAYLGVNYWLSGSLMTTSARAKSLASSFAWNTAIFDNMTHGDRLGFLLLSAAGGMLVASPWTPWRGARRWLALLIFAFPAAYYGSLAARSSWQIWSWYLYPMPICSALSLSAFVEAARLRLPTARLRARPWLAPAALGAGLVLAMLMVLRLASAPGNNEGTRDTARALAAFAKSHPGRYGMGDRAGVTALLVGRPLLQLEGLVADQRLLAMIEAQHSLQEVLESYGVDYLVEALPGDHRGRCQALATPKPAQAGELSPKLRGTFCDPLFRYTDAKGITTVVYAVASRRARELRGGENPAVLSGAPP